MLHSLSLSYSSSSSIIRSTAVKLFLLAAVSTIPTTTAATTTTPTARSTHHSHSTSTTATTTTAFVRHNVSRKNINIQNIERVVPPQHRFQRTSAMAATSTAMPTLSPSTSSRPSSSTPSTSPDSSSFLSSFLGYEGKIALVTGSTSGLGRAIAETLLQAGCKAVVINGRNEERTQRAADDIASSLNMSKDKVFAAAGDTSDPAAAKAIVDKINSTFGRLDMLVNNAGINLPEGSFQEQYSPENWQKISRVNMEGPMNMTHEALHLIKTSSPSGRIINVSSMIGHVGDARNPLYTMTKASMLMFTKSLAVDLARNPDSQHVTVNSISPGIFETEMNSKFTSDEQALKDVESGIPMKRLGQPKELAGAVLYLASDAASYTTGTDILVDGGFVAV